MEKEHLILSYIQQQEDVTQRDIARNTGMGLGTVNILLKKMIKKGLVKIERLNARSLRYMLTPKGLKEKTERTYKYIKRSYDHITAVTRTVEDILQSAYLQKADIVYLYGPRNEIYEIIKLALQQQKGIKYTYIANGEPLPDNNGNPDFDGNVVLVWRLEDEEKLSGVYHTVNILKELS
jgi:DNA-binding MarR family transcriptional regulator